MKFYLLSTRDSGYDEIRAGVVVAKTEDKARSLMRKQAERNYDNHPSVWTDKEVTSCVELTPKTEAVVLCDILEG